MSEIQKHIDHALAGLKDFQLATVEYVIHQFFTKKKTKILIADEVGLGKTIVSRGVVAKMFEMKLAKKGNNIGFNVIYICSNQAIAKQNIGKLNFLQGDDSKGVIDYSSNDDRLTSLSYEPLAEKNRFKLRIKAFTPATSFDQNSHAGRSDERALLFRLLFKHPQLSNNLNSLKWFFKGDGRMAEKNWDKVIQDAIRFENGKDQKHFHIGEYRKIRPELSDSYFKKLNSKLSLKNFNEVYEFINESKTDTIINILIKVCSVPIRKDNYKKYSKIFKPLLSHLRLQLSECCKDYLNADLFILDEFQRYGQLLNTEETDDPGVELARQILGKKNSRVLLLSATPFKPYTNDFDELNGESHFKEFDRVLRFLMSNEDEHFWKELERDRYSFFEYIRHPDKLNKNEVEILDLKNRIEGKYHSVISRTERMLVSKNKDAMVNPIVKKLEIQKEDIQDFVAFDKIVKYLNEHHNTRLTSPIEYAKSSPYPLSFLSNYQHKKKLEEHYNNDKELQKIVNSTRDSWLNLQLIKQYKPLFSKRNKLIPNPKLRLLIEETIGNNGWKYLWVPPSISYYESDKVFKDSKGFTKTLIFSSWKLVPRMISTIVSYEVERLSVGDFLNKREGKSPDYFAKKRQPSPLLTFKTDKEDASLSSMNNFLLNYPSIFLSTLYNPSQNVFDKLSLIEIKQVLSKKIQERLIEIGIFEIGYPEGDWQKWSWYSLLLLDKNHEDAESLKLWLNNSHSTEDVSSDVDNNESDKQSKTAKSDYFKEIEEVICRGKVPNVSMITNEQLENTCQYLADLCLGSPAICALRSNRQLFDEKNESLLSHSYLIAAGFISLFNKPESIVVVHLIKVNKDYYRKVLDYCIDGNIQSMFDEYIYMLKDSNSIKNSSDLATTVAEILSIRPSLLDISTISNLKNNKNRSSIRTHYALDFGEQKLSSAKANRQISIREAFNSPFRPFVLASTSIGQEGLDFHFYSKKIVHWNLPSNPIDFEQREGRIHRYKGHVIRLNVVEQYLNQITENKKLKREFIWDNIFNTAINTEKLKKDFFCDLIPCWHIEPQTEQKNYSIDRIVPLFPFSKDIDKFYNMLKVLAYYRFTFGQPRQEELIQVFSENQIDMDNEPLILNLSPLNKNYE